MENVIVTGSSGLIGSHVVRALADRYRVFGFDRPGLPHPPEEAVHVDVDLTNDDHVREGLKRVRDEGGGSVASCVHLAAFYDFSGEPSEMYEKVTVQGTRRLLDGLQSFDCEQFLFSSTMLVHAPGEPGRPITEDSPLDARWPYPQSKQRTEQLIRERRGKIPAVLLRIAGVYDDTGNSIPIVQQIQRIYEKQMTSRVFPGEKEHGQSFIHLEDAVDAIVRCVDRRKDLPPEAAFLIGEGRTYSYQELQDELWRLLHGKEKTTFEIPEVVAKVGAWVQDKMPGMDPFIKPWMIPLADDHYELDISRARQLLGWEPKHDLKSTLPAIVASLNADPDAWYEQHKLND